MLEIKTIYKRWGDIVDLTYKKQHDMNEENKSFANDTKKTDYDFSLQIADFNAHPNPDSYSLVVTGCISCHQKACPGPLERISKRELPAGK